MSFMDTLRRISGGAPKDPSAAEGPSSPRTNVWSSTFDPGRNANMNKVGSSYYDKPSESNPGGVWDQHLQSEAARPQSPSSTSAAKSGSMDADAVRKMFSAEKVEAALKKAETGGKVDYDRFMSMLRQNA